MHPRALSIGLVLTAAVLQWALRVDPAFAATSTPLMPSYSVSAKTETVTRRGTRLIVVRSVKVTGVGPSVRLAIRCNDCRRLRRVKIYRKKTATWRQYTRMYWILPRGRGISIDAIEPGKLGRWTVLGPGRRKPNRLVFKASGCLREVRANSRKRPRRITCPAGTTSASPGTSVPVAPRPADYYGRLINYNNRCLDLDHGIGPAILHWTCNGQANQRWKLTKNPYANMWEIKPASDPAQCADVRGNVGPDIIKYNCKLSLNQLWYREPDDTFHSYLNYDKCLDASGTSSEALFWPCNGQNNQRWRLVP